MRAPTTPLHFSHVSIPVFAGMLDDVRNQGLGVICFSSVFQVPAGVPCIKTPMLGGNDTCEVWLSDAMPAQGEQGAIRYRHDGHYLFGVIELSETENPSGVAPLQHCTESIYRQIFTLLDALQYPYSYRFWNYMSDINGVTHGLERYRQFNLGRQEAYLACGREVKGDLPAACALGRTDNGPLTVAFLAGRMMAQAIENPRQISAYEYPLEYGPRSPTFSRGCLLPDAGILFISGTASIVGHETLHRGDVVAQTRETLANLRAVIQEANCHSPLPGFNAETVSYRVYMRHAADMPLIKNEIERVIGPSVQASYVQADICRPELLLEIEASASLPQTKVTRT